MNWKYALKRGLSGRHALTAVFFLLITLWGALTVLSGVLDRRVGCAGYAVPPVSALEKTDPTRPLRTLSPLSADLTRPVASSAAPAWPDRLRAGTAQAEGAVTQALEEDHTLIQLFGLVQALSGRTVVEDPADPQYAVVRLPDGSLTFTGDGRPDPDAQAAELLRLRNALDQREIPLLYLQAPSKLEPGREALPTGVTDTSNACADALLRRLDRLGVDYLDFRQTLKRAGGRWGDWFYATDHHWTQRAAFLAFQDLCARLEEYDRTVPSAWGTRREPIVIPERYTDPDAYASATLSGFFLGSQGKRVGSLYAGSDDFLLHTPAFPTLLRYEAGDDGLRWGDAQETVLFPQRVARRDWFNATPYTYYAGGDYPFAQVTNYYNPQGPRVLLIRDSFACAITPYLALASSQLTTLDPRSFSGDLLSYVDYLHPDVVLILYSSGMVREEGPYRLLPQSAAPSKADLLRWTPEALAQKK